LTTENNIMTTIPPHIKTAFLNSISSMNIADCLPQSTELTNSMKILMTPGFSPGDNFKELLKPIKYTIGVPYDEIITIRTAHITGVPNFTRTWVITTCRDEGYYWNPGFNSLVPFTPNAFGVKHLWTINIRKPLLKIYNLFV